VSGASGSGSFMKRRNYAIMGFGTECAVHSKPGWTHIHSRQNKLAVELPALTFKQAQLSVHRRDARDAELLEGSSLHSCDRHRSLEYSDFS
jgi:hypothetical protein